MKKNKFGISIDDACDVYARAVAMQGIEVVGVDCHIGTQITAVQPFVDALARVKAFVRRLQAQGIVIRSIDLGGGLGVMYTSEQPPEPEQYAAAIISELAQSTAGSSSSRGAAWWAMPAAWSRGCSTPKQPSLKIL